MKTTIRGHNLPEPASRYERLMADDGEPFNWDPTRTWALRGFTPAEPIEVPIMLDPMIKPGMIIAISRGANEPTVSMLVTNVTHTTMRIEP